MKKLIAFALVISFMMIAVISVRADEMDLKSVDTILAEIRQEQNIASTASIDISKVTSAKLEELGDSVMEKVIGNTAVHDRMDIALGGDGSASLTNVHIRVGYDYLAGIPITMMTFMGASGMMGGYGYFASNNNLTGFNGMMGSYGWIWMIIGLLGVIVLISGGIYLLTHSTRNHGFESDHQALSIVKERYAKGEITREEYSAMIEAIRK